MDGPFHALPPPPIPGRFVHLLAGQQPDRQPCEARKVRVKGDEFQPKTLGDCGQKRIAPPLLCRLRGLSERFEDRGQLRRLVQVYSQRLASRFSAVGLITVTGAQRTSGNCTGVFAAIGLSRERMIVNSPAPVSGSRFRHRCYWNAAGTAGRSLVRTGGVRRPALVGSKGWNPSFNAGESGFSRKSSLAGSTKPGSATWECWS